MGFLEALAELLFGPTPEEKGRDGEASIEHILKKTILERNRRQDP